MAICFFVVLAMVISGVTTLLLFSKLLVLLLVGTPISKAQIGYGRKIASFKLFEIIIEVGCIPTGGFICIDESEISAFPAWTRILSSFVSVALLLAPGVFVYGFTKTLHQAFATYIEVWNGAFYPIKIGALLLTHLQAIYASSFLHFFILLCNKLAGITIVSLLLECISHILRQSSETSWYGIIRGLLAFILILVIMGWMIAAAWFAFSKINPILYV